MGKVWKLIKAFKEQNGRLPNGVELEEIRKRADRIELEEKIIEFPRSKITDWRKPRPVDQGPRVIPGGSKEGREITEKLGIITRPSRPQSMNQEKVAKDLEGLMKQGLIKKGKNVKKTKSKEPVDQKLVDDVKNREMFEAANRRLTSDQKLIKEKYEASNKIAAQNLRRKKKKKKKEGIESLDDTATDVFAGKVSLPLRLMKNYGQELNYAELAAEGYTRQQIEILMKAREILKRGDELNPNEALLRVKEEMADARGVDVDEIDIDFEIETGPLDFAQGGRVRYADGTQEDEDGNQLGFTGGLGKLLNNPLTRTIGMTILSGGTLTAPALAKEVVKQKAMDEVGKRTGPILKKKIKDYADPGRHDHNVGGGGITSSGIAGGAVSHAAAKEARGGMSGWGLAKGGRVGFAAGGIDKMRRAFLKAMGAGAATVGAAKSGLFGLLKGGAKKGVVKELTEVPIKNIEGMPAWFKPLVNRIIKEGEQMKVTEYERLITHKATLPDSKTPIYVNQDLNTGDVWVDIGEQTKHGWADGHYGQPVRLSYTAAEDIEPVLTKTGRTKYKGGKIKEEFNVEEAEFTGGHPENVKFEETTIEKFGDHGSDFSEVEKFAMGKVKDTKPTKKRLRTEWEQGKAEADADAAADMADDFADGGRVPMWLGGGLTKGKRTLADLLKMMAKDSSHGKTPSQMLQMINPKQFNQMLDNPEGIPSIAREMIEKYTKEMKLDRSNMIQDLIGTGRRIKKIDDDLVNYKIKIVEDMVSKGVDRATAKQMAENLAEMVADQSSLSQKAVPKVTDQGLLELENIGKNLATQNRKLNASGGIARMLGE